MVEADLQPGTEGPTVDSWSAKDQRIIVSQPAAGFLYDLMLRAKIDADPKDVYQVLIDPNSHEIFRGIKATLSRTTLEDDGKGRRKLRIGHRALTKFLWISVTFDTELFVWEDDVDRTIRFTNARSDGFMSQFDGTWHVQPFTQQTLDSIYKQPAAKQQARQPRDKGHNWLGSILHSAHSSSNSGGGGSTSGSALVTLNQALAPRARPPGPVAHLVRGLCGRVLHNMMEDLRTEVARRQQLEATGQQDKSTEGAGLQPFFSSAISSKSRQATKQPSLPVASLTLSSACSSSTAVDEHAAAPAGTDSSSSSSSSRRPSTGALHDGRRTADYVLMSAGQALSDMLAAAVPMHVTIEL